MKHQRRRGANIVRYYGPSHKWVRERTSSTRAQARSWNSVNGISVGNACAKVLSARPQIYDNELASKEVENAAEDHRHECAAHDNDVVRHAEVRRRQIDKEGGGIHPSAARIE